MAWFKKDVWTDTDVWMDHYIQEQDKIVALSFDEASRQAELLLADPKKFQCVPSSVTTETLNHLAPGLQSLFSRFESIHVVDDEAYLIRKEIALFDWDGNGLSWGQLLWKIGQSDGHSVTLVKPGDERVYDIIENELGNPYPSIYHWLLMVSAVASDFGSLLP